MKPKRRVVTHGKGPGPASGGGASPAEPRAGQANADGAHDQERDRRAEGRPAGRGRCRGRRRWPGRRRRGGAAARSPIVALGSPAIAPPAPGGGRSGAPSGFDPASVNLAVDLGRGLVLANPILVASGTFGYGVEYADVVDIQRHRRDLLQGHHPAAPGRQPASAGDRDAGRDAQLDRPPEPRDRRGPRAVCAAVGDLAGPGHRQRRRRVDRGLRRRRPQAGPRARRGRGGAQHQLPERGQGRAPVRDRPGRRGRRDPGRAPGDRAAAHREALARTWPTSGRSPGRSPTPAPTRSRP